MYCIDFSFFMDILVCFNSAFYDYDNDLVDNRKEIARNYMLGWFTIDLVAIIPFDILLENIANSSARDLNPLLRIARFGKLYKLVKLIRLFRMFKLIKVMKNKNNIVRKLNKVMDVNLGCERLFFILLIILMINHISACLYIILATMINDNNDDLDSINYTGTWL